MHIYLLAFKNFGLYCYYYYYLHILDFELFEVLDLIITIYLMSNTIYDQCLVFSTHLFKVVIIYSYHLTPSFLTFKRLWKTDIEKISIKFEAMQSWIYLSKKWWKWCHVQIFISSLNKYKWKTKFPLFVLIPSFSLLRLSSCAIFLYIWLKVVKFIF